jgi:aldehyde dehydrogenase family protein
MPAGDPRLGYFALGSVVSREAADRIESLVKDAVAKGAKLLAGGRTNGTIMEATVLDHATSAMRIYGEKTFRPAVCVVHARGVDDAIRIADDTDYGLSAAFVAVTLPGLWQWQNGLTRNVLYQRADRPRRATDAIRWCERKWLRPFWRQGISGGVHRAALDYHQQRTGSLSHLRNFSGNVRSGIAIQRALKYGEVGQREP